MHTQSISPQEEQEFILLTCVYENTRLNKNHSFQEIKNKSTTLIGADNFSNVFSTCAQNGLFIIDDKSLVLSEKGLQHYAYIFTRLKACRNDKDFLLSVIKKGQDTSSS